MPSQPQVVSLSPRSMSSVPRAVWIGGGILGLVTAALAGALVTRSVATAPAVVPSTTAAAASAAQPVPLTASAPPTRVTASPPATRVTALPPAKHVHPAKPVAPQDTAAQGQWTAHGGTTQTALCTTCGIVESVNPVREKGEGTGLGAVAGGVLGGVLGHQVGGGKGKTAMTVLGAIGGGLAGNEVEKRARGETLFDVQVRMEDGSTRTFQRAQSMAVGTHVIVEGTTLRMARESGSGDAPRILRTSAPAGSST